jgi:hypothetical protein
LVIHYTFTHKSGYRIEREKEIEEKGRTSEEKRETRARNHIKGVKILVD